MSSQIYTSHHSNKAGLCPHGLPPGACPICGSMAGSIQTKNSRVTKPSSEKQWSYMKCYAVGMAMHSQKQRMINAKLSLQKQLEFAQNLRQSINSIMQNLKNSLNNIQKTMPTYLSKTINFIINITIIPILKIIAQIPKLIEKFVQFEKNFMNFIHSAGEKLSAILGDIKNFLNRNFTERLKKKAKKFFLFFISDTQSENYKNDETLSVFKSRELKKYLIKILKRNNNK